MKRHDNTLYVTTQGAYLARDGTNVAVRVQKETRLRVPIHNLGGIVCFGNVSCSPFLMGLCGREGVAISFLSRYGRFNRQQVAAKGFKQSETGGVEMDDATRKTVLVAYQKRKDEELVHPFLKEKMTVGLLPHVQARLLARWLRGELDAYPPMLWK